MEKEVRQFDVNYDLCWEYGVEISQIRKDLDELEKLGATHVQIEPYTLYDISSVEINAISERLETDKELTERLSNENKLIEEQKKRDLEFVERIKKKYYLTQI